jgi:hypothetical protein
MHCPAGASKRCCREGALRVTEVDRDIRRDAEPGMICQLSAAIPSQRCHDTFGKLANLPDECVHHCVAIFALHLNQHDKAGSPFHQRGDVTIFGSAQQIAFPPSRDIAAQYPVGQ